MATLKPAYRLTLGGTRIDSSDLSREQPLLSLRVDNDLAVPAAALDASIGNPQGVSVSVGDAAKLELGYESSLTAVFSGTIESVRPDLARLQIQALSSTAKLLRLRVNQVYEKRSAGQIVTDLAGQAGMRTGTIQDGLDLPFYVVNDARNAYQHCRDLAERAGFDLYVTPDDALTFALFDKRAPDHSFSYGRDLLELELATGLPAYGKVEVWGESPASAEGADAASWLARDFSSSKGSAGSGGLLRISDPAIRTKDAAGSSAQGRQAALARRAVFGVMVMLGDPSLALGDSLTCIDVPDDRLSGVLQIKRVTHRFSKAAGFTTRLELLGTP